MDCAHHNINKVSRALYEQVTRMRIVEAMSDPDGAEPYDPRPWEELSPDEQDLHLCYAVAALQAIQDVFGL